mmetsp:Transcript_157788/g.287480  ORF Transcript_157788/g.287480 Transcript_157788/m.287480 type:complete len:848 (-) Transcript_157788:31-2574(-)
MATLSTHLLVKSPLALGEGVKHPFVSATAGLASYYSSVANDGKAGGAASEAAMLLSTAEGNLKEGLAGDCLEAATKAEGLFKGAGDKVGAADSMSMIVNALRMEAEMAGEMPMKAMDKASEEMQKLKSAGDKRGEMCMTLAYAEIKARTSVGSKDLDDLEKMAVAACAFFQEKQEKKMAACAQLVISGIFFLKMAQDEADLAAAAALELFTDLGDKAGQAKSLHAQALASLIADDFEKAITLGKKALALYEELDDKKSMVFELSIIAQWTLSNEKPSKALQSAKKALSIAKTLSTNKRGEAIALYLTGMALAESGQSDEATKAIESGLASLKDSSDAAGIASGHEAAAYIYMALSSYDKAVSVAEEGLVVAQNAGSKQMELNLLYAVSMAQMKMKKSMDAVSTMRQAQTVAQTMGNRGEEAYALRMVGYIYHAVRDAMLVPDPTGALEGIQALEDARSMYMGQASLSGEAACVLLMACLKMLKEGAEDVLELAKESQALYQKAEDVIGENLSLGIVIDLLSNPDSFADALKAATTSVELWTKLRNKKAQAVAMYKVAEIYQQMGQLEEASDIIKDALTLCKEAGAKGVEARLLLFLTQIHIGEMQAHELTEESKKEPPPSYLEAKGKALKTVKDALLLAGKAGDEKLRGAVLYWRAEVLVWALDGTGALRAAEESLKIFTKTKDAAGQAHAMVLVGDVLLLVGQKDKALEMANKAVELAQKEPEAYSAEESALKLLGKMVNLAPVAREMPAIEAAAPAGDGTVAKASTLDLNMTLEKITELLQPHLVDEGAADLDTPFMDAGIDSLASVAVVNDITREFRLSLSPSAIFDFPTTRELAAHLIEESGS